jgi:tetratricopeptide (TPR) repeat protein
VNDVSQAARNPSAETHFRTGRKARDSKARRREFEAGIKVAEARLGQNPDDPEGLYWLANNMGALALERGKMSALPVVPKMEKLLLRLHEVAPTYANGGAARVLGRLYDKAPAMISIGSAKKARLWLERALTIDPDHPGNLAFAAEFFANQGEGQPARDLATRCRQTLDRGEYGPDEAEWRAIVTAVLEDS